MSAIAEQLALIKERIADAARRSGRDPDGVTLIGVSKTHPPETVRAAQAAGLAHVGENRVQEAEGKIAALADTRAGLAWHLIGHLQSNKAKKAAALFDLIQSLDSLALAQALDRHAGALGRRLPVLLQVNVSGEASKEGFALAGWEERPAALDAFCAELEPLLALPQLEVRGLMTIAPLSDDPAAAPATFRSTRRLRDALAQRFPQARWDELSMGMTDDFEDAIAEGATIVRIGRAIFGSRG
ncbi:MAG TPA: YggS family pyridoxal phosphate-dependent enzyme [Roseiflexaceae bacterium]|nr:YggS family pyridoxal phosphate-dependent enzyme [Roseiflexaceae bacterium]